MGLANYLRVLLPTLPTTDFETKSLLEEIPSLLDFEIRSDGTLWREVGDLIDDPVEGSPFLSWENLTWEPLSYTGEIRFYAYDHSDASIKYSAYFLRGHLKELHLLSCIGDWGGSPKPDGLKK